MITYFIYKCKERTKHLLIIPTKKEKSHVVNLFIFSTTSLSGRLKHERSLMFYSLNGQKEKKKGT